MDKKTLEELTNLSHEELAKYCSELDSEMSSEIDKLKANEILLKGEIEKMKKATLSFVSSSKTLKEKTNEDDDKFDLKDIL